MFFNSRSLQVLLGTVVVLVSCSKGSEKEPKGSEKEPERHNVATGGDFTVTETPRSASCSDAASQAVTVTDGNRTWNEAIATREIGKHGQSVCVEYSSDSEFSGNKTLMMILDSPSRAVRVLVAQDTDYGYYVGSVDSARSTVHMHADGLCFDLTVVLQDGSGTEERWRGAVSLTD